MEEEKKRNGMVEFFKPTKRKIKVYVIVMFVLFILDIFLFMLLWGCLSVHCSGNTYHRSYYACGVCVEPTIMKDIVGYTRHYFFEPFILLFKIIGGNFLYIPFFLLNIFIWYSFVCVYVKLKEKKVKRLKNKKIVLLFIIVLLSNIVYSISDSDPSNNIMNKNVDIVNTKKLDLNFYRVDGANDYATTVKKSLDFIKVTYPVSDDNLKYRDKGSYTTSAKQRENLKKLLWKLSRKSLISNKIKRTVGILPGDWFGDNGYDYDTHGASYSITGFGSSFFYQSVLVESVGVDYTNIAAHELGHSIGGFCEEYDADEWDDQDSYLTHYIFKCPNGDDPGISGRQLDQDCIPKGCPVTTLGVVVPSLSTNDEVQLYNFMGNANISETWVSEESYNHLLSKFKKFDLTAEATILINGLIDKSTDSVELFAAYELDERYISLSNYTEPGNYSIETFDSTNNTIFYLNFTPSFFIATFNGTTIETNESYFIFVINNTINNSRIEIKKNGILKASMDRTATGPVVNITSPLSGENKGKKFNLTWNATDNDADSILYSVLVSTDNGGNYSTLTVDLNQTYYEIDPKDMDYSEEYAFKILATDGFNTGTDAVYNITSGNPLRITYLSETFSDELDKTIRFIFENQAELNLSDIEWTINYGDGASEQNFESINLQPYQYEIVDLNHTYTRVGNLTLEVDVFNNNFSYSKILNITADDTAPSAPLIIYPNEGETITESPLNINWTQSYDNQNVLYYIDYSDNSGTNWYEIITNYGLQAKFNESSYETNLSYEVPGNKTFHVKIPKNSIVTNAYFKISTTK